MSEGVQSETKTLRWGIIGLGTISSWFVSDIVLSRPSAPTKHIVQALGSSSISKAEAFTSKNCPSSSPTLYDSYEKVYSDPDVDIVYIGTPHTLHFQNALDAVNTGKHVLCEKPLVITAKQAEILIQAAKEKKVFFMEAIWTRFFPIVEALQTLIHTEKIIGDISRVFIDFGLDMPISSMPDSVRSGDPSHASSLLGIGMYTLTWASIILDLHPIQLASKQEPQITSSMIIKNGTDETTSMIINYPSIPAHAICTSTLSYQTAPEFCRIEGSLGSISVGGDTCSQPGFLVIRKKGENEERRDFAYQGWGYYFQQDAVAQDIRDGKTESEVMTLDESLRIMRVMDEVRKANGLRFPDDE